MPCYVTYKIRTQLKAEDVELFKSIASEHNLTYTLEKDRDPITGKYFYLINTTRSADIGGVMEDLTAKKMVKEAKKRNWKVKEVQVKVKV